MRIGKFQSIFERFCRSIGMAPHYYNRYDPVLNVHINIMRIEIMGFDRCMYIEDDISHRFTNDQMQFHMGIRDPSKSYVEGKSIADCCRKFVEKILVGGTVKIFENYDGKFVESFELGKSVEEIDIMLSLKGF